jgi:hypothetical protein
MRDKWLLLSSIAAIAALALSQPVAAQGKERNKSGNVLENFV